MPDQAPFELSPEEAETLAAARRQLEEDAQAGRIGPGQRRCVTLPDGTRFQLAAPGLEAEPVPRARRRSWLARLLGRARG